jgi:hypothetical protein
MIATLRIKYREYVWSFSSKCFILALVVKGFLEKYRRECKAAMLLVVVYSIHLFTYQALLSNPDDFLSRASFRHHETDPCKSTDFLLLLAKKHLAKEVTVSPPYHTIVSILNPVLYPQWVIQFRPVIEQSLSTDSYKRYRLLRVLLV